MDVTKNLQEQMWSLLDAGEEVATTVSKRDWSAVAWICGSHWRVLIYMKVSEVTKMYESCVLTALYSRMKNLSARIKD